MAAGCARACAKACRWGESRHKVDWTVEYRRSRPNIALFTNRVARKPASRFEWQRTRGRERELEADQLAPTRQSNGLGNTPPYVSGTNHSGRAPFARPCATATSRPRLTCSYRSCFSICSTSDTLYLPASNFRSLPATIFRPAQARPTAAASRAFTHRSPASAEPRHVSRRIRTAQASARVKVCASPRNTCSYYSSKLRTRAFQVGAQAPSTLPARAPLRSAAGM
jgi:hypothetical protein